MSVSLTPSAVRHVKKSLSKRGSGIGLRLAVKTSGCNGFAYALEFVDAANAEDECFETLGVMVVVDPRSLGMLAPVGGLAKGTPYQALTPDGSTVPATAPLEVVTGASALCTGAADAAAAATSNVVPTNPCQVFMHAPCNAARSGGCMPGY